MCNTINSDEYDKLIKTWNEIESKYSKTIIEDINFNFSRLKHIFPPKMLRIFDMNSMFPSFDEKIYDYYNELILCYKEANQIYEKSKSELVSENLQKLLEGLCSVLKARIYDFEETHKVVECKDADDNIVNPVYFEKKIIIEDILKCFVFEIEKQKEQLIEKLDDDIKAFRLKSEKINDVFEKEFKEKVIDIFSLYIKACAARLNDVQKREVATFYMELLKEEKEILATVIKVQVDALENQEQTGEEAEITQRILAKLREAYQHANKYVDSIIEDFHGIDFKTAMNFQIEFDDLNEFVFIEKNSFESIDKIIEEFDEKFNNVFAQIIDNLYANDDTQAKATSAIENDFSLAEEVIETFSEISEISHGICERIKDDKHREIAAGILETIQIKLEILNEEKENLKESLKNTPVKIQQRGLKIRDSRYIFEMWLKEEDKENFLSREDNFLKSEISGAQKKIIDNINKKLLQFKKEHILYEITTFEEILNYSVTILRNSGEKVIKDLIFTIDSAVQKIEQDLAEHNIKIIKPKPHEIFNGRMHEVLMAEKNEEFKKGEIIKVMNNGFMQNETVIIRANVIAAK